MSGAAPRDDGAGTSTGDIMTLTRLLCALAAVAVLGACAAKPERTELETLSSVQIDPARKAFALREVASLQKRGARVWCVPFARNASGIQIRGNANTWWSKAKGLYERGHKPRVGAVMTWNSGQGLTAGHVAVVSEIVSDRLIKISHANWSRNKVSLNMQVMDVSDNGDWSAVRVESAPGAFGRTYGIRGFISPNEA